MSDKPKVEVLPIEAGATPDLNNVNKHTQRGRGLHENSMRKRGANRSIVSAGKGVDVPVVMAGNQTLEIAAQLGMEIINVHTNGKQIVNVVRDDIAPGSAEFYASGIEDNEIGKQSYNPDLDILAAVMADKAMQALRDEDAVLNDLIEGMRDVEKLKDGQEVLLDQAIQLEPAREYVVIMCNEAKEFDDLRVLFRLQEVRRGGYRKGSPFDATGVQRVIRAKDVLELYASRNTE